MHIVKINFYQSRQRPVSRHSIKRISVQIERKIAMNKADFVSAVAEKSGVSKKDTDATIKAITETITEIIKNGDSIALAGIGTFSVVEKGERVTRNPRTGENVTVPAHKAPKFKAAKALKDAAV